MEISTSADLESIQLKVKDVMTQNTRKQRPYLMEKVARRSRQILARIFCVEKLCVK